MKVKLYQQNCGSKIAVGIEGNEQDVTDRFNSFWNHNATSQDEPEWIFDNELAFCSTWDKLTNAMNDIFLFILLNDDEDAFKGEEGGAMPFAKELAKAKIAEMDKKDSSMRYGRQGHVYTLGEVYTNDEKAFSSGRNAGE